MLCIDLLLLTQRHCLQFGSIWPSWRLQNHAQKEKTKTNVRLLSKKNERNYQFCTTQSQHLQLITDTIYHDKRRFSALLCNKMMHLLSFRIQRIKSFVTNACAQTTDHRCNKEIEKETEREENERKRAKSTLKR